MALKEKDIWLTRKSYYTWHIVCCHAYTLCVGTTHIRHTLHVLVRT